jgi:hypothetical protein
LKLSKRELKTLKRINRQVAWWDFKLAVYVFFATKPIIKQLIAWRTRIRWDGCCADYQKRKLEAQKYKDNTKNGG